MHRTVSGDKSGRTSSRDSVKGPGTTHRDRSRTGGSRREEGSRHERRTTQSGNKAKKDAEVVDDDERDRLEVAEIVRRMEDRNAAKELEASRLSRKETRSVENVVNVSRGMDKRVATNVAKSADKIMADSQRATKKVSTTRTATTASHTTQREAARC